MDIVFAPCLLLYDLSAVILVVVAELYSVERSNFDVACEWLWILRNFWLFGSIDLQIELLCAVDFQKD